jgi:integrase
MAKQKQTKTKSANGAGYLKTDPKTGYLYGVISWTNKDGKRLARARRALSGNKTEARQHIEDMRRELKLGGQTAIDGARLTLGKLAERHMEVNQQPAVFNSKHVRVSGLRAWRGAQSLTRIVVEHFGADVLAKDITLIMVREYKRKRLQMPPTKKWRFKDKVTGEWVWIGRELERERSVASVNRELATLRCMLNYAVAHGWIRRNPIAGQKDLINKAEENQRTRVASKVEEKAFFEQLQDRRRLHLVPYYLTAFDHGCRSIELRQMLVGDVDFDANVFRVYSFKGKKRLDREHIMTSRVREALLAACQAKRPDEHVFTWAKGRKGHKVNVPITYAPKRSFATAKRLAKFWSDDQVNLDDFRGHDVRHTTITRLVKAGMPVAEACKIAGHTTAETTWRYVNPDNHSRQRAADLMEAYSEADVLKFQAKAKASTKATTSKAKRTKRTKRAA